MKSILDVWRFVVKKDDHNIRFDHFLTAQEAGPTRSQLKRLIESGYALLDGETSRPSKKLKEGQVVDLKIPPPEPLSAEPEDLPIDIVHEDEFLLVVNKQQGLVVHPAPGHPRGTLVNGILHACALSCDNPLRPGIVHRLDKDTSGLMVVAKNEMVHVDLAKQFHVHSVDRRYTALVSGDPPERGEWKTLHGRKDGDRKKFSTKVQRGKIAVSIFKIEERYSNAAMLKVELRTGRTHQVRVHCQDHGFPILGDPWYGPKKMSLTLKEIHDALPGQALHAEILGFNHPVTKKRMFFRVDPPDHIAAAIAKLRQT